MRLPVIRGIIDRRILVNYRADPDKLAALLPRPFRPKLVHGYGMAGICLIRLKEVRPTWAPRWLGIASENAAHRIAVEWRAGGARREGVFILRRDTNSRLNALAGGRIFPGVHHQAAFVVRETEDRFEIALESDDRQTSLAVVAESAVTWPGNSIFASLAEASRFFEAGSLGYSPSGDLQRFQGLELRCRGWHVEPLSVRSVRSSLFDDPGAFPPGTIQFDCALLMRGIEHEWLGREDLCCHQTTSDPMTSSIAHQVAAPSAMMDCASCGLSSMSPTASV